MFTSIVLVSAQSFMNGEKLDKNGKPTIILNVLAGQSPNRTVVSGTVAERAGFVVGKAYLAQVREVEADNYGRRFQWSVISEASPIDIIKGSKELGAASIFSVDAPETSTTTGIAEKEEELFKSK